MALVETSAKVAKSVTAVVAKRIAPKRARPFALVRVSTRWPTTGIVGHVEMLVLAVRDASMVPVSVDQTKPFAAVFVSIHLRASCTAASVAVHARKVLFVRRVVVLSLVRRPRQRTALEVALIHKPAAITVAVVESPVGATSCVRKGHVCVWLV